MKLPIRAALAACCLLLAPRAAASASASASGTTAGGLVFKLEAWGTDGVRVRVAAPGATRHDSASWACACALF